MKTIISLLAGMLCITQSVWGQQSRFFTKLSVYDCITCTNNLGKVVGNCPDIRIVLDAQFANDSAGIMDKFNLRSFSDKLIWDKQFYDQLSKADMSEVIQYCDNVEVQRMLLKSASNFKGLPCRSGKSNSKSDLKPKVSSGSKAAQSPNGCSYTTPGPLKLIDFKFFTIIENYVTDEKFILNKKEQQVRKIQPDDSMIKQVYLKRFKNDNQYLQYMDDCRADSRLRPKVTAATFKDDSTLAYCIMTYYIDQIRGNDTSYNKMFTIVTATHNRILSIDPIVSNKVNDTHGINEYEMFFYKNELYFLIIGNPRVLELKDLKVFARFSKDSKGFQVEKVEDLILNDYSISYNIFYNYSSVKLSHQYLGFPLADYILDLNTNHKIQLPFDKSVFEGNKKIMNGNTHYILNDLKFNPATNIITLFYEFDGVKYYSLFTPGASTFIKTTKLYPLSYYTDFIKNASLKYEGSKLIFVRKGKNCIEECELEDSERVIASGQ